MTTGIGGTLLLGGVAGIVLSYYQLHNMDVSDKDLVKTRGYQGIGSIALALGGGLTLTLGGLWTLGSMLAGGAE